MRYNVAMGRWLLLVVVAAALAACDLRHSAVSFAVAHGADIYSIQRMVGHSKPSITLDVYGELWDTSQEQLAEKLDAAIRAESEAHTQGVEVVELPRS